MIIGLTGGIASGKSTASKILEAFGGKIIDVDRIAREAVMPGTKVLNEICDEFGAEMLLENGELNRKLLGSIVFQDKQKLGILNRITHADIRRRTKEILDSLVNEGERAIIVDAALLFEIGLNLYTDVVWYIYADINSRIERLSARNGYTEAEALSRIEAQNEAVKNQANEIILNNGSVEELETGLSRLWIKYIGEKI